MTPKPKPAPSAETMFGRLKVLDETRLANTPGREAHGFRQGLRAMRCECSCGTVVAVSLAALLAGNTSSCGCLHKELAAERGRGAAEMRVTHGLTRVGAKHPMYGTWHGMMTRCYDPRHLHYDRYGGRGITVDPRWHDPAVFVTDILTLLGPRPPGKTLDRRDNDAGYQADNMRWASKAEQSRNRGPFPKKLAPELIAEMQARRAAGAVLRELAADFGVSIACVHRYCNQAG